MYELSNQCIIQLEATEQKFAAEAKKDEEAVLKLKAALKRDEELAAQAKTKPEKLKIIEEERVSQVQFSSVQFNLRSSVRSSIPLHLNLFCIISLFHFIPSVSPNHDMT